MYLIDTSTGVSKQEVERVKSFLNTDIQTKIFPATNVGVLTYGADIDLKVAPVDGINRVAVEAAISTLETGSGKRNLLNILSKSLELVKSNKFRQFSKKIFVMTISGKDQIMILKDENLQEKIKESFVEIIYITTDESINSAVNDIFGNFPNNILNLQTIQESAYISIELSGIIANVTSKFYVYASQYLHKLSIIFQLILSYKYK